MTILPSKWGVDWVNVTLVTGIVVCAALIGGAGYMLYQQSDVQKICVQTCAPYAARVIDEQCECMDEQKRWTVQE